MYPPCSEVNMLQIFSRIRDRWNPVRVVKQDPAVVPYDCGHRGASQFTVRVYGEEIAFKPTKMLKCGACVVAELQKFVLPCCRCRRPIFPGNPVASYDLRIGATAKKVAPAPRTLGCMRSDCCPTGSLFAGHWNGERLVPAFDHGNAAVQAFITGKIQITHIDDKS